MAEPSDALPRLLGAKYAKGSKQPAKDAKQPAEDVELGDWDTRPLLKKVVDDFTLSTDDIGQCRAAVSRFFGSESNAQFADDAELAVRAAFFVVVVGLPFLIPRDLIPTLDSWMKAGVYTNSVIIFFIYNLYKTTGATIMNVMGGFRGATLAVANMWMMYYFFPDGVTETTPDHVFWAGVANGVVFIMTMLVLNWQTSTVIFSISNFIGWWMAFLQPGEDNFQCPFTEDFHFRGNTGVNQLITVAVGAFCCVMVTFFPYPRWSQFKAQSTSKELIHQLPLLWKTLTEFFSEDKPNSFHGDQIHRRLERLSRMAATLSGHIEVSWYECFGRQSWHHVRRILTALEKMINESYDRIHSTYTIAKSQEWHPCHAEFMQKVKPTILEIVNEVEVLLRVCFQGAFDGSISEVEEIAIKKVVVSLQKLEADFTREFIEAREKLSHQRSDHSVSRHCMEELQAEHIFALNFSSFVRLSLGFADDLISQRRDPNHFPAVTEMPAISSLWDRSAVLDPAHLNWVLRAAASIFSGFLIGFFGYSDLFTKYNSSIACTCSVLLSKFAGSAMVKNLGRIQGVVLGTVVGQMVHALLGSCADWSVVATACVVFLYAVTTLFTYYNSTQHSYIACLLAANGCGQMLMDGCGSNALNKGGSYDTISSTVCAISLIVFYDMVFSPGRASDFAHKAMCDAIELLDQALCQHFDKRVDHVRFHKGELQDAIAKAEGMGREACNEPRYWRTAWQEGVFSTTVRVAYHVRLNLAAMEYAMSENFTDGGRKNRVLMALLDMPGNERLREVMMSRMLAVRPLVDVFAHETEQRFPGLTDPRSLHTYRFEWEEAARSLLAEVAKDSIVERPATQGTLEEDPICQVCMVMGSMESVMLALKGFQHAILRGE